MTRAVVFHRAAEKDLDLIYEAIAEDSPSNAIGFVRRLREHCLRFAHMPHRGQVLAGTNEIVRTTPFEKRAVIAYRVDDDRVTVLRIAYAGRDLRSLFADPDG
ncbi:type II toxin-antitoxin system RelE/ParE family toxin [Aureimonas psammosilenae]|uniref:type II toxin-antitoxin system RelE/ParE family toxin n=1 Tax=Aureimonas psammosilenae TaxID=2495496 RepID=UPI0012606C0F|nr:type II toxin-antitoxin system RelE/ParE family toxin [Aureimonas psammosilenae]